MKVFISHSSCQDDEARAVKQWLITAQPSLRGEVFLDRDDLFVGQDWRDALGLAAKRCAAVIFLVSKEWHDSEICQAEFNFTRFLKKPALVGRLDLSSRDTTAAVQRCDLFVGGQESETVRLPSGTKITLRKYGLEHLLKGLTELGIGVEHFPWPPQDEPNRSPYRGWAPMQECDAAVFFGRDTELARARQRLGAMRSGGTEAVLAISAPTGAGKSAFLRAGLRPRLLSADRQFLPLQIVRPERAILTGERGLAAAIDELHRRVGIKGPGLSAINDACRDMDVTALRSWVEQARAAAHRGLLERDSRNPAPTVVLLVDQGEELFSTTSPQELEAFLTIVAGLLEHDRTLAAPVLMVVTIRDDSTDRLRTVFRSHRLALSWFTELVDMPTSQFRDVILRPAERVSEGSDALYIEPALVDELIHDCETSDALPVLALTMERLYRLYGGDGDLTLAEYKDLKRNAGVLQNVVNDIVGNEPDRRLANLALLRQAFIPALASINIHNHRPGRRIAEKSSLPPESAGLIKDFADNYLLVEKERNGRPCVEVAVESLFDEWKELSDWLEAERDHLEFFEYVQFAARRWDEGDRVTSRAALHGRELIDAEALAMKPRYASAWPSFTAEFLQGCRQREHRRQRTVKIMLGLAAVGLVFALVGFLFAGHRYSQYQTSFRQATAQRLASQAQAMIAGTRPGGDFQAIQQILAAPKVLLPETETFLQRLLIGALPSIPSDRGMQLDAVVALSPLRKIIQTNTPITSVAVSPDASLIVTGAYNGKVQMWEADTGVQHSNDLVSDHGPVWSIAVAGTRVIAGNDDGWIEIWDTTRADAPPQEIQVGTGPIRSLAVGEDRARGPFVVAGSTDGRVRTLSVIDGSSLYGDIIVNHKTLQTVAVHDHTLVTGSEDGTVARWNMPDGRQLDEAPAADGRAVWDVATSPNGDQIAIVGNRNAVSIWNPVTHPNTTINHPGGVWAVAFDASGRRLVTGGVDDTVRVWDSLSGKALGVLTTGDREDVKGVAFLPDGIVSVGDDNSIRIWNVPPSPPPPPAEGSQPVVGLAFSDSGVAAVHRYGAVQMLAGDLPRDYKLTRPDAGIPTMVAADDTTLVSAYDNGSVQTWSPSGSEGILISPKPQSSIDVLEVGGHRVASLSLTDGAVRVWNTTDGAALGAPIPVGRVAKPLLALDPAGRWIAIADGGRLRLLATGVNRSASRDLPADGHPDSGAQQIAAVAFDHDATRVVTGAVGDDRVRLWDTATGEQIGDTMTGHQRDITSVDISPARGDFILSGAQDGTVRLWDARAQIPVGEPIAIPQPAAVSDSAMVASRFATSVAFSPDESLIVAGLNDGTVLTWPGPAAWIGTLCDKVAYIMNGTQWAEWVSKVKYAPVCPDKEPLPN